jgi:hypothetical protein
MVAYDDLLHHLNLTTCPTRIELHVHYVSPLPAAAVPPHCCTCSCGEAQAFRGAFTQEKSDMLDFVAVLEGNLRLLKNLIEENVFDE